MLIRILVAIILVIPACFGQNEMVVKWEEGNPYSSSFLYNGFKYRVIRIFDTKDPSTSVMVGVAGNTSIGCPGPGRRCTTALLLVGNEGTVPFDLEPQNVDCMCINKSPRPSKPLNHYSFPRFLQGQAQSTNVLLKANTIFPGDNKSGAVIFSGRCNEYEMHVALTLSNRRVSFQFPGAP